MKYALITTTHNPQKEMVEELYLMEGLWEWRHSTKLSDAMIWDDFDTLEAYVASEMIDDHKIVRVKEKDLFEARLKGT